MYGDVGLPTTKGSGTNGYIQRSLAYINRKEYQPGGYKAIIEKFREQPAPTKRKINNEIIEHEMKHKIEAELYDLSEKLKEEGKLNLKEIEEEINKKRNEKYDDILKKKELYINNKDTHQRGQMKNEQINKIKNALKIKDDYQMGFAFDFELQKKEKKEKKKTLLSENKIKDYRKHRHHKKKKERRKKREKSLSFKSRSRSRSYKRKYREEYSYEKEEGSISN